MLKDCLQVYVLRFNKGKFPKIVDRRLAVSIAEKYTKYRLNQEMGSKKHKKHKSERRERYEGLFHAKFV